MAKVNKNSSIKLDISDLETTNINVSNGGVSNGLSFNTFDKLGSYRMGGSGAYKDGPLGNYGHYGILEVTNVNGDIVQRYIQSNNVTYQRIRWSGTWSAWTKMF